MRGKGHAIRASYSGGDSNDLTLTVQSSGKGERLMLGNKLMIRQGAESQHVGARALPRLIVVPTKYSDIWSVSGRRSAVL